MILYPAIDIKGGQAVRLVEGRMEDATVFNEDPAAQAQAFEADGFTWLHVVDLDGAFVGQPRNAGAVAKILQTTRCPVQLGGGVRSMARIDYWIDAGVSRIILGTAAVRHPELVKEAAREFPEQIAVGIDAREGLVAVEGWVEQTSCSAVDLARQFEDAGVAAVIVTDIARDGRNEGVNVALSGEIADAVRIPVIASGGLAGLDDIHALKTREGRAIAGVVIGRALYDGRIDAAAALKAAAA